MRHYESGRKTGALERRRLYLSNRPARGQYKQFRVLCEIVLDNRIPLPHTLAMNQLPAIALALLSLPGVHKAIDNLHARILADRLDCGTRIEYIATIRDNGKFTVSPGSDLRARVSIDGHVVMIAHTHPDGGSPLPSEQDIKEAIITHIPDIVVSRYAEYLILPTGQVIQIK